MDTSPKVDAGLVIPLLPLLPLLLLLLLLLGPKEALALAAAVWVGRTGESGSSSEKE